MKKYYWYVLVQMIEIHWATHVIWKEINKVKDAEMDELISVSSYNEATVKKILGSIREGERKKERQKKMISYIKRNS